MRLRTITCNLLTSCIFLFIFAIPARSQTTSPWTLVEDTVGASNLFGYNTSGDDSRVVVSSRELQSGSYVGSVTIFDRLPSGVWTQVKKFTANAFAPPISLDGDVLAVTTLGNPDVEIFERNAGGIVDSWGATGGVNQQSPPYGQPVPNFGITIHLDGDRLFVSAGGLFQLSVVYVYERNSSGNWIFKKVIQDPGNNGESIFGGSLASFGDRLVVGAPGGDSVNHIGGNVFVFEKDAGGVIDSWGQTAVLSPNPAVFTPPTYPHTTIQYDARFGAAVDADSDEIVVGAPFPLNFPNGDRIGSAYIFRYSANAWNLSARLTPFDGQDQELFGMDVTLEDNKLAVASTRPDEQISAVYVHERSTSASDDWSLRNRYIGCSSSLQLLTNVFWWAPNFLNYSNSHLIIGSGFSEQAGLANAGKVEIIDKESTDCSDFLGCSDQDIYLPVTVGLNSSQTFATSKKIFTTGDFEVIAPSGNLNLSAGEAISLGNGFSVEAGARFSASISASCS